MFLPLTVGKLIPQCSGSSQLSVLMDWLRLPPSSPNSLFNKPMMAQITIGQDDLAKLVRQSLENIVGIQKIGSIRFLADVDHDERPYFTNCTIQVELKEKP